VLTQLSDLRNSKQGEKFKLGEAVCFDILKITIF